MIKSKADLKEYLEADKRSLGRKSKSPSFSDIIWKFEISLRKKEYYKNCCPHKWGGAFLRYYGWKHFLYSVLCGFSIPENVFGKGLSIAHRGTIIVNSNSKIGDNCRLHACVNIGTIPGVSNAAPEIGNNVYIAPGVKIYGKIKIASGIIIGANAVVNKSFEEEDICIAGIPAKIISKKGRMEIESKNRETVKIDS